jgi:ER lumen protein retaining receptor
MKIFFLGSSFYTVYLMTFKFKATYDKSLDTFKVEYLLLFAAIFSLLFCYDYKVTEVSRWTT